MGDRVELRADDPLLLRNVGHRPQRGLLVPAGEVVAREVLDDTAGLAVVVGGGGVVGAVSGALPRVSTGGIGAGHRDVTAGHAEFRRGVPRTGVQPPGAENVHEAVAETQDHRTVAGEGEGGELRLRIDEGVARLPFVPRGQGGVPRVPVGGLSDVAGAGEDGAALGGERMGQHRVEPPTGIGGDDGLEVGAFVRALRVAHATDVQRVVVRGHRERPPVGGCRAARVRDVHRRLGCRGGGAGGPEADQAAGPQIDRVERGAVLRQGDAADALLARGLGESRVLDHVGGVVRRDGGAGHLREQPRDAGAGGGHGVDRVTAVRPVGRVPPGELRLEQPVPVPVVGQPEGGADLGLRVDDGRARPLRGAGAAGVRPERHQGPGVRPVGAVLDGDEVPRVRQGVVGRVPDAGDHRGVLAGRDVHERGEAVEVVRCGGGRRGPQVVAVGRRDGDVDAVPAAGECRRRRHHEFSGGVGDTGDVVAGGVGDVGPHAPLRHVHGRVDHAGAEEVPQDLDRQGAVGVRRAGRPRARHRRARHAAYQQQTGEPHPYQPS